MINNLTEQEKCFLKKYLFDTQIFYCAKCNVELNINNIAYFENNKIDHDFFIYFNNKMVCKDCYEKMEKCFHCNRIDQKLFCIKDINKKCCLNCITELNIKTCFCCNDFFKNINVYITHKGFYCDECKKKISYFKCTNCVRLFLDERYGADELCITCANEKVYNCLNYTYKPRTNFYHMPNENDNLFMGVELECGCAKTANDVVQFIEKSANCFFYMKRDASIPAYGCEIVTHPATLAYHESNESGWKELFDDFNKLGFVSGTATHTGLHIHVSRNIMTEKDWKKVDLLINVARNFFEKCARRASTHYCSYNLKSHSNWGYSNSRYESVNFQNSHTVEFRIFNGTNDINELFASLELVKTIVLLAPKISYEELYENFASVKEKMVQISKDNNFKHLIDFMEKIKEKW